MLYLLLPALLALPPAVAGATPPQPDDAGAAVPETRYRAPLAYRPAAKQAATPDRHWIEANRSVLGYNPMMLTMPERASAPAASRPASAPASAKTEQRGAAPGQGHADQAAHGAHAGHGGHDGKGHH